MKDSIGVLISSPVAQKHGDTIRSIVGPACELFLCDGPTSLTADEISRIQISFLSADLMGESNKGSPNARLAAFTDAGDSAKNLKWMHTCSAGTDRPLLQRAMKRGVTVTTSSGANAQAVAQNAIGGMLALARGFPHWFETQRNRQWITLRDAKAPPDLDGSHALVVGMGPIGESIARTCKAIGLRVTGVRRKVAPHEHFDEVIGFDDIRRVLPTVDWVMIACPATPQTRNLVNTEFLEALPKGAHLINISRGEIVDEPALFTALETGALAGVYSDVFVEEPLPADSPWWTAPNSIISAHSAASSIGFVSRTEEMFLANLRRYVKKEEMAFVATPSDPA